MGLLAEMFAGAKCGGRLRRWPPPSLSDARWQCFKPAAVDDDEIKKSRRVGCLEIQDYVWQAVHGVAAKLKQVLEVACVALECCEFEMR